MCNILFLVLKCKTKQDCALTVSHSLLAGGVCSQGGICSGGVHSGGVSAQGVSAPGGVRYPPPPLLTESQMPVKT